jgi:phage/plasmid-associated DNA primase
MDFGLHDKLILEREGIMAWAVEGFRRLHARGRFVHTAKSAEATAELLRHLDQIGSFLGDAEWITDYGPGHTSGSTISAMFEHWRDWCESHAVKAFTDDQAIFGKEVRRKRPEWEKADRFKRRQDEMGKKTSVVMGLGLIPKE